MVKHNQIHNQLEDEIDGLLWDQFDLKLDLSVNALIWQATRNALWPHFESLAYDA